MAATTLIAIRAAIKDNPGKVYVYVLSRPCGTPFYVGVGTGRRIVAHERNQSVRDASTAKAAVVREIIAAGQTVGYEIAAWFDDWTAAAAEERRLIAFHGRADRGLGPLANRTNGGQGTAGVDWHASPKRAEGVRKAKEKNRGRKHTEASKAKLSAALKGREVTTATRAKISAANKGHTITAEQRARLSAAKKGRKPSAALLAGGKKYRDEHAAKISEKRKGWRPSQKVLAAGAEWRAANAEAISAKRKALWADPEYRRMMKSRRWPDKAK